MRRARSLVPRDAGSGAPQDAQRTRASLGRRGVTTPALAQSRLLHLVGAAEHPHAVAPVHGMVAARAHHQIAAADRSYSHRSKIREQLAQGRVRCDGHLGDDQLLSIQVETVGILAHTGLDHRRREQARHVQYAAGARNSFHAPSDRWIVEIHDHLRVGAQFTDEQGGLQSAQVVALNARDRRRSGKARLFERLRGTRAHVKMGHPELLRHTRQQRIWVVVDDHDRRPGGMQLLDDTQSHTAQSTHDHVSRPRPAGGWRALTRSRLDRRWIYMPRDCVRWR